MSWIVIIAVLFLTIFIVKTWLQGRNKKPLPSGPTIIESFSIMMGYLRKDNSVEVAERLTAKYGDIFVVRFLGQNFMYLNSTRIIRKLFSSGSYRDLTNDRAPSFLHDHLYKGGKDIAFSGYDETLVKLRKIIHNVSRLYGEGIREFEETINTEVKKLERKLEKGVGQESFDLKRELVDSVINIVHIFISNQPPPQEVIPVIEDFNDSFNELISPNKNIILSLFPWLKYFPGPNGRLIQQLDTNARRLLDLYLNPDAKKNVRGNGGLIDKLLSEQETDSKITDEYIQGVVMDAVAGGFISTAGALSGFFLLMLHYPDIQHRIQEELDDKLKGRQPSLDDRPHLHYTNATILEMFRYIRHVPLAIPHQNKEELEVDGFTIPAKSALVPNLWSTCRGKDIWGSDDEKFNPQRFLNEKGELIPSDHPFRQQLISFSVGKRNCVGEAFARSRLFLYVTSLLQKFEFQTGKNELVSENSAYWINKGGRQPQFVKCKIIKRH